ncbi:hypothetical protein [Methylomonas fluvii]|nr:hypothetical protein [Methylomonas fluvii]
MPLASNLLAAWLFFSRTLTQPLLACHHVKKPALGRLF